MKDDEARRNDDEGVTRDDKNDEKMSELEWQDVIGLSQIESSIAIDDEAILKMSQCKVYYLNHSIIGSKLEIRELRIYILVIMNYY